MTTSPPKTPPHQEDEEIKLAQGLYIVPTPIGNIRDITLRAIDTLKAADLIASEDTRVTGKLLKFYNITTPMISYYTHNAAKRRPEILKKIKSGESIALVSDAGTPIISDPGYKLVNLIRENKEMVTALPGANAAITALCLSGLPSASFTFAGFLPPKKLARQRQLEKYQNREETLIYYETAPRLLKTLNDIEKIMPQREIAIGRELTKYYEELKRDTAENLIKHYTNHPPKGEIVLLISPKSQDEQDKIWDNKTIDKALQEALNNGEKPRAAALKIAALSNQKSQTLYKRAINLKKK